MVAAFESVRLPLQQIYEQVLDERNRARYDAELWRYYGHLRTPEGSAKRTRFVYDLCRLARFEPADKVILDAGCGFGAIAVIMHLMGAREVHGVDITESRLGTFQKIIEDFQLHSVRAYLASVDNTGFPNGYFDMVLSNEAISHYGDVDAFLREAARVLKPGGVLLIADGNNGANPYIAHYTSQIWARFENGPAGAVHGHTVQVPYVVMRAEIIRQAYPDMDAEQVHELARRTSYLHRDQILAAVERYRQTGEWPNSYYQAGTCPLNPYTGAVIERLFHPVHLARHIESFGFRAQAYAYFGGAGGNALVRFVNEIGVRLSPFTMRLARGFRIVAVREG